MSGIDSLFPVVTVTTLVQATIISHFDYGKSFPIGLPASALASYSLYLTDWPE